MRIFIILIIVVLQINLSYAQDRILASKGNHVKLTIDQDYKCSPQAKIKIITPSADYFDQDAEIIQKLVVNTAGTISAWECPKIAKIEFMGITDGVVVFRADAHKSDQWKMQSYPPPLEGLALVYSNLDPNFHYLSTFDGSLEKYIKVKGMTETYQFEAYKKQIKRLLSIVDGNVEAFTSFINQSWKNYDNLENAITYYNSIMQAIKIHVPEHFPLYNSAYIETFSSLATQSIIENNQFNVEKTINSTAQLSKAFSSKEFQNLCDQHLESWIEEEVAYYKDTLSEAPLYEVAEASSFIASFPDNPTDITYLEKVKSQILTVSNKIMPLIEQRIEELEKLAKDVVKESGQKYTDVETVFETGFSLAEEFEGAGFNDQGLRIVVETFEYIEKLLASDLASYKKEFESLEFKDELIDTLKKQALTFEELSNSFQGFKEYQKVTEDALKNVENVSCEKRLKEVGIHPDNFGKLISVGKEQLKLVDLASYLNEQNHRIIEFSKSTVPKYFVLGIREGNDNINRFHLKSDRTLPNNTLTVVEHLNPKAIAIDDSEWREYIEPLIHPPDGDPDKNGIRESDKLAADPHDPEKLTAGVNFNSEDYNPDNFNRAVDACIAAVENAPNDPRQQFQLGRVLWHTGEEDLANEYLGLAAKADYAAALYYKAEILLASSGDDNSAFVDALDLYNRAGKLGYKPASAMVKELNPEGTAFFNEVSPPTGRELIPILKKRRNYKQAGELLGLLGAQVNMDIKNVKIIESFQIAERTFSCEYKEVLDCGVRSTGLFVKKNDPFVGLMSKAFQYDCNNVGSSFGTFRKQKDGSWRYFVEPPPKKWK